MDLPCFNAGERNFFTSTSPMFSQTTTNSASPAWASPSEVTPLLRGVAPNLLDAFSQGAAIDRGWA